MGQAFQLFRGRGLAKTWLRGALPGGGRCLLGCGTPQTAKTGDSVFLLGPGFNPNPLGSRFRGAFTRASRAPTGWGNTNRVGLGESFYVRGPASVFFSGLDKNKTPGSPRLEKRWREQLGDPCLCLAWAIEDSKPQPGGNPGRAATVCLMLGLEFLMNALRSRKHPLGL